MVGNPTHVGQSRSLTVVSRTGRIAPDQGSPHWTAGGRRRASTDSDALAGQVALIYGLDGVGSPLRRESVKTFGSVDGGGPSCCERIRSAVLAGDPLAGRAAV